MGVQVNVSDQVIAVIDNLAQKFGIIIDWGQESIVPYIQQLCTNYIKWEVSTSIAWICFSSIFLFIGFAFKKLSHRWHELYKNDHNYSGIGRVVFMLIALCCWVAMLIIIIIQVLDIVKCCTFPELQIFEYIKDIIARSNLRG